MALVSEGAEQRLALAMDAARLGSWTWDMASGSTTWDRRLEEMHGLPPGGFGGTFEAWVALLHPDDRAECIAMVEAALADPGPYVLHHRTVWADGSVHALECRGTVLVDAAGRPVGTTGVAIDVTAQQQLVQTLQRALLPVALPSVPGVRVAARYRTAGARTDIGGDWYAAIALPGGRLGLAVGDVAGHGLDAVAQMAAARFSLRALALDEVRPDVVLARLDAVIRAFHPDALITALYGVLDPAEASWTYASAGHVPALVRRPGGEAVVLDDPADPPLGIASGFESRRVEIGPGSAVVLYTDGLIERRDQSIDLGLARLAGVCAGAPSDPDLLGACLLDVMLEGRANDDDIAVVVATLE